MPTNPYDVYIDGKGYIIKEGTYASGKQQLAADQFRTGDPSYENLTEQQAWPQSDWRGGIDFAGTNTNTQFSSSIGIDIPKDYGSLQLSNNLCAMANRAFDTHLSALATEKAYYNSAYYFGNGNSVETCITIGNYISGVLRVAELSGVVEDVCNFNGSLWATVPTTKVLWTSPTPDTQTSWSAAVSASFGVTFHKMETNGSFMYLSDGFSKLYAFDGTGSSGMQVVVSSPKWAILQLCSYNGRLYMGCVARNNPRLYALRVFDGSTDWTIQQWTASDQGTNANPFLTVLTTNNSFNFMCDFAGKLYFNIDNYQYETQVFSFNGDVIQEEIKIGSKLLAGTIDSKALHVTGTGGSGGTGASSDTGKLQGTIVDYILKTGNLYVLVAEGTPNQSGAASHATYSIYVTQGSYWYQVYASSSYDIYPAYSSTLTNAMLYTAFDTPGTVNLLVNAMSAIATNSSLPFNALGSFAGGYGPSGVINSVMIDMDLFSLNKKVSAMEIYHSSLKTGHSIQANLFTYTNTSSTYKTASVINSVAGSNVTILKANDAVGMNFQYQIYLSASSSSSAYSPLINDVVLRWVLEPEDKEQVTFDVLAVDNIQLNDGSYEARTGAQIAADLKAARKKAIVSFTDLDGTVYNTTSSDPNNRGMIVKDAMYKSQFDQANSAEFVVTVTMVQA